LHKTFYSITLIIMPKSRVSLSRDLSLFSTTMIGIGGMIGAGIFALTGIAAGLAGPALILVFLLNGLLTLPTAMAYAELASSMPRAGGGYVWVNEAVGGVHGFLCGWMSWFAYIAVGSLYALAFGHFAAEAWITMGLSTLGISAHALAHVWMAIIILSFTLINALGAKEMAYVGNVVTVSKLIILSLFVLFGLGFMTVHGAPAFHYRQIFMPHGVTGMVFAMGLTYIAFEGFEIIAQSGEEVMHPKSNIPRAIFLAMGITVTLYILVAWVTLGAVTPPPGKTAYAYLGQAREMAIVDVARQIFPWGSGGFLMLLSGLAATASALNVAAYSASRVAFAMGRTCHLPAIFARIHAENGAPLAAIIASGTLMFALAFTLPIEAAATAGSIMFLFIFIQVNYAVIMQRYAGVRILRSFRMPAVPYLPLAAMAANVGLAAFMYALHPAASGMALVWVVAGMLTYFLYFAPRAERTLPKEVVFEEIEENRGYTVLTPVEDGRGAANLGSLAALFARAEKGEVAALNVICVPRSLSLSHGHVMLGYREALLDRVDEVASTHKVPVHRLIRLGRDVAEAVRKTSIETHANLLLLGWPGYTKSRGRMMGSVIDPLLSFPPCDLAIVRLRKMESLKHVLVAVDETANSLLAVRLACGLARSKGATLTLLHVVKSQSELERRADTFWDPFLKEIKDTKVQKRLEVGHSITSTLLKAQQKADIIFLGATHRPLWQTVVLGNIPKHIARESNHTTVIVQTGASGVSRFISRLLRKVK